MAQSLPPEVLTALQRGQLIEAIRLLRKATGFGLAQAKAIIDAHLRDGAAGQAKARVAAAHFPAHGRWRHSHLSPGEVPRRSGSGMWIVLILAAAALGVWFLLR